MSIYDTHKPESGGGGLYLKISDGDTVKLRIASDPAIFQSESQPDEHGNTRLSTRYGWIVFNQDTKEAQILQQGPTFFKQLAGLAQDDEWGDPTGYDIKITRRGSALDTTYTVMPSNNREPLDTDAKQKIESVNLIEKLQASPFAQNVMWLTDFDNPTTRKSIEGTRPAKTAKVAAAPKEDVVIEDIGDEPINLDDIPF